MTGTDRRGPPRYQQAAALVRAQITGGTLRPGQPAPSGAQLARVTGFSPLTCRKALRLLISDGTLVPGPSPTARPRVAASAPAVPGQAAGSALPAALAAMRHAAGLTQAGLAAVTGYCVTTIGHAETGRLWQSRQFWETVDKALAAGGDLLTLYGAAQAVAAAGDVPAMPGTPSAAAPGADAGTVPAGVPGGLHGACIARGGCPGHQPPAAGPVPAAVTITWSDGTVTTVHPPAPPARA